MYDLTNNTFLVSENVIFYETCFPIIQSHDHIPQPFIPFINPNNTYLEPILSPPNSRPPTHIPLFTTPIPLRTTPTTSPSNPPISNHNSSPPALTCNHPLLGNPPDKQKPSYISNYHCNLLDTKPSLHPIFTPPKFTISFVLTYNQCNNNFKFFCISVSSNFKPTSYSQAYKHVCWLQPMQTKLQALDHTNIWTIVDLRPHKTPNTQMSLQN